MLYVFQVDTGQMLTFDMNLALDSVSTLKEAICDHHRIPLERQVLLVSGGECLQSNARVCAYAAGTDTNPIFLFNINNITTSNNPSATAEYPINNELFQQCSQDQLPQLPQPAATTASNLPLFLESAYKRNQPPTYETLSARSSLSQQLYELGKEISYKCEATIHDQHLQHQGWAAVIANLEDIVTIFNNKINGFKHIYLHPDFKLQVIDLSLLIQSIPSVLNSLRKLPLLKCLITTNSDDGYSNDTIQIYSEEGNTSEQNLLDWITSQDSADVQKLAENCSKCIDKLDSNLIENLIKEAENVVEKAGQLNMKEIKGLGSRLYALDQLLTTSKKLLSEQQELATAFAINTARASDLKDSSILPDLCASHEAQLAVMSKNHTQLEDIKRRCVKAKEELSLNLNTRLKWVMFIQKNISDINLRLSVYFETLKQFKVYRQIVHQISSAQNVYLQATQEIHRRALFQTQYHKLTTEILSKMTEVYNKEVSKRSEFNYSSHFLLETLFPELSSMELDKLEMKISDDRISYPKISTTDLSSLGLPCLSNDNPSEMELVIGGEGIANELKTAHEKIHKIQAKLEQNSTNHEESMKKLKSTLNQSESALAIANAKLVTMTTKVQQLQATNDNLLDEKQQLCAELLNIKAQHQTDIAHAQQLFQLQLHEAKSQADEFLQTQLKNIKEKHQADLDAVKSRVKFLGGKQQQQHNSLPNPQSQDTAVGVHGGLQSVLGGSQSVPGGQQSDPGGSSGPQGVPGGSSGQPGEGSDLGDHLLDHSLYLDTSAIDVACNIDYCVTSTTATSESDVDNDVLPENVTALMTSLAPSSWSGSCRVGEAVLIYWNEKYEAFVVVVNNNNTSLNKNIHFLHTESSANLRNEDPPVLAFVGNVLDKEFCVARRAQNRYKVPQGFHFYRVKTNVIQKFY